MSWALVISRGRSEETLSTRRGPAFFRSAAQVAQGQLRRSVLALSTEEEPSAQVMCNSCSARLSLMSTGLICSGVNSKARSRCAGLFSRVGLRVL